MLTLETPSSPSTRQEMVTGGVTNRERKLIPQKAFF